MIDPKELRIGNLLHRTINNKTWEVQLELTDFHWWAAAGGEEEYDPIPITPEWLERLGFGRATLYYPMREAWLHADYGICVTLSDGKLIVELDPPENAVSFYFPEKRPMTAVHHLQNMYFALTGEELKLKDIERTTTAD